MGLIHVRLDEDSLTRRARVDPALRAMFDSAASDPMFEYRGRVFTVAEMERAAEAAIRILDEAGVADDCAIGLVARTQADLVAAMLGLLSDGRPLSMIHPLQTPAAMAQDVAAARFAAVIARKEDWTQELLAAARSVGTTAIWMAVDEGIEVGVWEGTSHSDTAAFRTLDPDTLVELLSSGTTGKPKRVPIRRRMIAQIVGSAEATGKRNNSFDITIWTLASVGGFMSILGAALRHRPMVLMEKFRLDEWLEIVERHRPQTVIGVPAMVRMILDADVPPERIASIRYWYGGSAPFPEELKDELFARYGIITIWAYGATEFCGTVASWNPDLHAEFGAAKRGSCGRALPGVALRVVDADGTVLPTGEQGFIEARIDAQGPEWIRTTDLGVIDADGFLYHRGRGDGAIVRGGFKVLPETVLNALLDHPAVRDAAVVGLPDARLGETPAAAVELKSRVDPVTPDDIIQFLRDKLPPQAVPSRIRIVDQLPRTATMKAELASVRRLFE